MFFPTSVFAAATGAALVAVMGAQPAAAVDYRQLVAHANMSGVDFCNSWRCNCVNYVPSSSDLSFKGTVCEPGNSHGKNTTQEAQVFCIYTNGKKDTSVIKHVAAATGATIIAGN